MDDAEREYQDALGLTRMYIVHVRAEHPGWNHQRQLFTYIVEAVNDEDAKELGCASAFKEYGNVVKKDQIKIVSCQRLNLPTNK